MKGEAVGTAAFPQPMLPESREVTPLRHAELVSASISATVAQLPNGP
jgi:hypothetical protein